MATGVNIPCDCCNHPIRTAYHYAHNYTVCATCYRGCPSLSLVHSPDCNVTKSEKEFERYRRQLLRKQSA